MKAVFKRELKAYFSTPIGFLVLAAYYFFLGLYFTIIYSAGSPDTSMIIMAMSTVIVFTVPIITMRLMSEDRRQKVDQALLTAPVKLSGIVMGKFLAAMALFAIGFVPTVVFELIIVSYVSVNIMSFIYSLLGILLLGGALIAIGMFISSLTESSVVSAILTLVINILIILFIPYLAESISVEWVAKIFENMAFINKFSSFGENLFSIPDIFYFLSITAAFLFLCVRALEKRRWA